MSSVCALLCSSSMHARECARETVFGLRRFGSCATGASQRGRRACAWVWLGDVICLGALGISVVRENATARVRELAPVTVI